ncbi:DegV family protein [Bacillus massiliigorillae]|uniref:DegV family protein n=1 Tax=Bacillus massiliigorillae TaxID=1243664 RepID=UPI0003A450CC|nr:DegV family protein [Bacillus massiliigorillae]
MNSKKIAWITDSTAFITDDLKNHPDLYVIPLGINFNDASYEDGVNLTTEILYRSINEQKEVPKTSQPSVGKVAELCESLKKDYDAAIAIHVSSKISGTLASVAAGAELAEFPIEVVDSTAMSYVITTLLHKGMDMCKQGIDYKEIADFLREDATKNENYILLGNLDQFYKGGRMSGTQYLLGNLLKIKPIIRIHKGEFELFEKVRSEKRAVKKLLDLFGEAYQKYTVNKIEIMHGNVKAKAQEYKEEFLKHYPGLEVIIGEISSSIAVHAGEGTIAIIWHNEPK